MKYTFITLVAVALLFASYNCMAQRRVVPMRKLVPAQPIPEAVQDAAQEAVKEAVPSGLPAVKESAETAVDAAVDTAAEAAVEVTAAPKAVKAAKTVKAKKTAKAEKAAETTESAETADASDAPKATYPGSNDQWKDSQDVDWMAKERASHVIAPHFNNRAVLRGEQHDGHTYGNYSEADLRLWQAETERLVLEGSRIFHSADLLGSTNGTSCDMCHPDAQITHPETYPKYQVQLGRAALLRDMINWCLENPCRAEPMSGDDPRMRAMEAYIQAQASGKPMKYGKH